MCLGCHEMRPKKELLRIVRSQEGEISLDFTGKKPGRGAYVCFKIECLDKAVKGKKLERAFEQAIPGDIYEKLHEELEKYDESNSNE